jgi:hypothetical protein
MSVRIKRWLLTCTFATSSAPRRYMTQSFFVVGTLPLWTFLFDLYTITKRTNRKRISCFVSLLFELVECKYLQFFLYILSAKNQVFRFFFLCFWRWWFLSKAVSKGSQELSLCCKTTNCHSDPKHMLPTCSWRDLFISLLLFFYKCKQLKIIGKVSLRLICFYDFFCNFYLQKFKSSDFFSCFWRWWFLLEIEVVSKGSQELSLCWKTVDCCSDPKHMLPTCSWNDFFYIFTIVFW